MGKVVTISWPTHGKDLIAGLWKSFQDEFKADFEVSVNGCYLKAHHVILAAFCPPVKQSKNSTLILGENPLVSKEDVEMLFKFLYRGRLDVDETRLPSLKIVADQLGFKTLSDIISKFLCFKKQDSKCKTNKRSVEENKTPKLIKKTDNTSKNLDLGRLVPDEYGVEDNEIFPDLVQEAKPEDAAGEVVCSGAFNPETQKFVCRICKKGYAKSAELSNHLRVHAKLEVRFSCRHCDYKTNSRSCFSGHMINRHQMDMDGNPQPKHIKCPECAYVCSAEFQLKNHTYQVHSFKKKVCESCGYRCQSDAVLEKHKKLVHSNVKPLMCETCGYRAKIAAHLRRHMRIHYGTPRVSCDVCGTSVSVNYLSQHKKIHSTTPKPHCCQLCGFTSWKNWNLKFHLKTVHKMCVDAENNNSDESNPLKDFDKW